MLRCFLLLFLTLLVRPCFAHEAHVHGHVQLTLALEGQSGEMSLFSAQANFLPFEYVPQTSEEITQALALQNKLAHPEELFVLSPEAVCNMQVKHLEGPAFTKQAGHHEEHGHEHGHGHEHANIHMEIAVSCEKPEKLRGLRTTLFETFPAIREIALEVVGPFGQRAAKLEAKDPSVTWQ